MAWIVEFDSGVEKDLKKLDRVAQQKILTYLESRIATDKDPGRGGRSSSVELGPILHTGMECRDPEPRMAKLDYVLAF